jgi:sulfoxide reductase catalytic subunit YedY
MAEDRSWDLPERQASPKEVFLNRRRLIGWGAAGGLIAGGAGAYYAYRGSDKTVLDDGRRDLPQLPPLADSTDRPEKSARDDEEGVDRDPNAARKNLTTERRMDYSLGRPITEQIAVARNVNYYEFSPIKLDVWRRAKALPIRPWTLRVDGLVKNPKTFDLDDLIKSVGLEQRVYRHRCVETWAMVVPWLGFPLKKIIDKVQPSANAKHVRFVTADVKALTGIEPPDGFVWPYQEGLRIDEANHDLCFLAVGYYGEALFRQNGAPIRLVVPWKYGFKSAKSIVRIEFTAGPPPTFWNVAIPSEYGYFANVDPDRDHPRWSQKREYTIDKHDYHPTEKYNGYGEWVSGLYRGDEI